MPMAGAKESHMIYIYERKRNDDNPLSVIVPKFNNVSL